MTETIDLQSNEENREAWPESAARSLASAVLKQAVIDARSDDLHAALEARRWLLEPDARNMCEITGINHQAVKQWVSNDCPAWRKPGERG